MSASARNMNKHLRRKKNNICLVFDEAKRREFLTGFHKRKLQRKKKAQEEIQKQLKDEKKRIKTEAKEMYKKMVVSYRPIPELESVLKEEYDDENVNVKVIELSNNFPSREEELVDEVQEECEKNDEEIIGMELKQRPATKEEPLKEFKSEKHLRKEIRKQSTKSVQKSKVFQKKNKMERLKQRKKAAQQKKERLKQQNKTKRKRSNK